jgi:hypothetical protein
VIFYFYFHKKHKYNLIRFYSNIKIVLILKLTSAWEEIDEWGPGKVLQV